MLAALLAAVNAPLISSHWFDAVFVRLRRALGLRLEPMVLFVAEFTALSYYRALRDGAGDPLTAEVAGRILVDEERHVRSHSQQPRPKFAALPPWARLPVSWAWQLLVIGTACVVVPDHGAALRGLGGTPPAVHRARTRRLRVHRHQHPPRRNQPGPRTSGRTCPGRSPSTAERLVMAA